MAGFVRHSGRLARVFILLILTAACSPAKPVKAPLQKADIQTTLEMISEVTLRVTYIAPYEATELFFKRTPDSQRQKRWSSLTDKIVIEHKIMVC